MNRTKILSLAAAIAAIALLFSLAPNFLGSTGFFGLGQEESGQTENQTAEEGNDMKTGLSFTVLKQTVLKAEIIGMKSLPECPNEAETEIFVKNSGNGAAEKVFLEFGPGIKAIACSNCFLEELKPGQEAKARARLCLEPNWEQNLVVGSANSNIVELQFKQKEN